MAAAIYSITTSVRLDSTLSDRARELLILRVSWLRGAEYQLLWHARLASQDGWSPEEIARTALGSTAAGWDPVEAQLLRAAEELCSDACIGDATWNELAAHYSEREMMEIVFVVGAYEMLAMALNSFGVQPEPHLPPFPPVH
jgi:alkylhydroperoxidase family enzyme